MDKAVFDLLLRSGNDRMGKAPAQLHGNQGDDLHRLAGAGGLFHQHVARSTTDIREEPGLIRSQGLGVHRRGKAFSQVAGFPKL